MLKEPEETELTDEQESPQNEPSAEQGHASPDKDTPVVTGSPSADTVTPVVVSLITVNIPLRYLNIIFVSDKILALHSDSADRRGHGRELHSGEATARSLKKRCCGLVAYLYTQEEEKDRINPEKHFVFATIC